MTKQEIDSVFYEMSKLDKEEYEDVWDEFCAFYKEQPEEAQGALDLMIQIVTTVQGRYLQMQYMLNEVEPVGEC